MAYAHFTGLLTSLKPEDLEYLDNISLDRIPHVPLDCESEGQNKLHLINALKQFDLKSIKLLHAIMNQKDDKVLALLEEGVQPHFSVFSVFILQFLFEKIITEPFNTDINRRPYHEVLAAYANPDILNQIEHPSKNTAMKILESLLCYGFQPEHLLYNAPEIRLVMHVEQFYEKVDLVLQALSRKSFLVNHLKKIDQTHAGMLIQSIFQKIYSQLFNFADIFVEFSSVIIQQREEIAEMLAEVQQKIERNPVEFGLVKFMKATEMETVIPCKPVAALVFKYLADPNKNVFEALQLQKKYKYAFTGIFPPG